MYADVSHTLARLPRFLMCVCVYVYVSCLLCFALPASLQQQDAAFYRSIAHTTTTTLKARRSREAYRESRMVKHTGPTPFARWAASRFSILRIASFQSTYQSPNLSCPSSSFSDARIDAARCPDLCIPSGPLRK